MISRKRKTRIIAPPDLTGWHAAKTPDANGHGDCQACGGRCCTYLVVQIPRPRSKVDIDEVRWWLAHHNVEVYIEDRQWHVQFYTPCRHLTSEGRCAIYPDRFDVCRAHEAETCEMSSGASEEISFSSPEQFDKYLASRKKRKKSKQ